jgi:pyruvate kinase
VTFDTGDGILAEHASALLGPPPEPRHTRIMVTMPSEAASDAGLVRDLVASGMDVMRVNCAHDDAAVWRRMVANLRRAERDLGRRCRVSFDLAGPKLRTGPIEQGPPVVKWRPQRDELGRVTAPARVLLAAGATDSAADPAAGDSVVHLPVAGKLPAAARVGDTVELVDTRGRKRRLDVVETGADGCLCTADSTAYVQEGTRIALRRKGRIVAAAPVAALPGARQWLLLHPGDLLDLVQGEAPGRDAVHDDEGRVTEPAHVSCALPEVFLSARVGERVFFDDGRIGGVVRAIAPERLRIEITSAIGGAAKLRGEKGINLPDSTLSLPALTAKDVEDLRYVARNADMLALSFVQRPDDVDRLLAELGRIDGRRPGIILKIETQRAFECLPHLLLAAMRRPPIAVMVARGDLGIEVGFERLSEVQEEILWLCEAAHVPVIWATQVLESLAKGGMPSRAEVTDAAMGARAECVMLNKGPFIREAMRFLVDVLGRMEAHQSKKFARLRKLRVSDSTGNGRPVSRAPATVPAKSAGTRRRTGQIS